MKRIDNRTEEEILKAANYAINDSFWKSNIRSTKKLREKFETLIIQCSRKEKSNEPRRTTKPTEKTIVDLAREQGITGNVADLPFMP
jgi:hypothetical protein